MGENQSSDLAFSNANLEQAVKEIRQDEPDEALVEAAAARVWSKLQAQADEPMTAHAIRNCSDFQALIPEYRAGKLTAARAMLLEDHLHQCVACRRIYEGRVTVMPAPRTKPARPRYPVRWAAAAVVVAAAGLSVWVYVNREGSGPERAIVQGVNGTLWEVSASGIRPLAMGENLREGLEVRTAPGSDAMLRLRDGSVVEMRERSGMAADSSAKDLTIHLTRGSVIVQAAKRSAGHLYVVTPECRVAVTGTVFGVTAGLKGSRVSVLQGEVHVSQEHSEQVLHPGDQTVTGEGLEPEPVRDDIGWSRNRDRYFALLAALGSDMQKVSLPELRYSSRLIDRLPAQTMMFGSVPNLSQYLGSAESLLHSQLAQDPQLQSLDSGGLTLLDKLRAASSFLGTEVVIAAQPSGHNEMAWVFLAQVKRDGFAEFVKEKMQSVTVEQRNGFVLFGLDRAAVAQFAPALDTDSGGFAGTPFYQRIKQVYQEGAGLLLCVDLTTTNRARQLASARYLLAGQKEVDHHMEASATLVFDKEREGIAGWLAAPAAMGSLDYFSPDASVAVAFVTQNSRAIVDQLAGVVKHFGGAMESVPGLQEDVATTVGGEFGLAVDGPLLPTPSWKLVVEVYDQAKFQSAINKVVQTYDAYAAKNGGRPLRTSQESLDGRTYYMVAGADPNPLTEAHYTFSDGYMIAGPSVALVKRALETKITRDSLARSPRFTSLAPRDRHANFSAVMYQNVAPALGPIANLLSGMLPGGKQSGLQRLGNLKPSLIAAYGDPDRLTVATDQNFLGDGLSAMLTGNVAGMLQDAVPFPQFPMRRYSGVER